MLRHGRSLLLRQLCIAKMFSSIAQSVEHAAVNRGVVGSSPTGGARVGRHFNGDGPFFLSDNKLGPLAQLVRAAGS